MRVLCFAYSAEPGKGSEPGAGWGMVRAVSRFADVTTITSPERAEAIERWQQESGTYVGRFVGVPEPGWRRRLPRHRISDFLVYLSWLKAARREALRLVSEEPFDVAYHATFSVYWLPSPVVDLELPSVWGPVGGAVTTPAKLWPHLGAAGLFDELLDLVAVRTMALLPGTRSTWRRATRLVLQNQETRRALPREVHSRCHLLNHVLFLDLPARRSAVRGSELLYVSPLESRKAPHLVVRALARTPEGLRLTILGDGPERQALEALVDRLGVRHRVAFLGRVPREEVFSRVSEALAVVFTGLREEGGLALAEAMFLGAPAVVLARGGAQEIAASTEDPDRVRLVEPGSATHTVERLAEAMSDFYDRPREGMGPHLDQDAALDQLRRIFEEAIEAG